MARFLRRRAAVAGVLTLLLILLVAVANLRAAPRSDLLPPEPHRPITLSDGSTRPLIELVSGIGAGRPQGEDLVDLAEARLRAGDIGQALALYQSVGADHPRWADCQRRIGWDILTRERREPTRGVAFVNAALVAEPLQGNGWQDAARVYLCTLGLRPE
jgi:hypothetical protein